MLDLKWTTTPDKLTRRPACEVIGRAPGADHADLEAGSANQTVRSTLLSLGPRGVAAMNAEIFPARIVPVRVPLLAAPEEFLYQLFSLLRRCRPREAADKRLELILESQVHRCSQFYSDWRAN